MGVWPLMCEGGQAKIQSEAFPADAVIECVHPLHAKLAGRQFGLVEGSLQLEEGCSVLQVDEVIALDQELFPIRYQKGFYDEILSGEKQIIRAVGDVSVSLPNGECTTFRRQLLGVLVYDIQTVKSLVGLSLWQRLASLVVWPKTARVCTLGVMHEFRRRGIGSLLLAKLTERVQGKVGSLSLMVIEHNKTAREFYLKEGFGESARFEEYYHVNGRKYPGYYLCKLI